jgi:hypothetical protein
MVGTESFTAKESAPVSAADWRGMCGCRCRAKGARMQYRIRFSTLHFLTFRPLHKKKMRHSRERMSRCVENDFSGDDPGGGLLRRRVGGKVAAVAFVFTFEAAFLPERRD